MKIIQFATYILIGFCCVSAICSYKWKNDNKCVLDFTKFRKWFK